MNPLPLGRGEVNSLNTGLALRLLVVISISRLRKFIVTKPAYSPLVVRLDAFPITDLIHNLWGNPAQEGQQHP